jgi:hypothetical protein
VHIACFSFGNIYAILVLGCVVSMSSADKMTALRRRQDGLTNQGIRLLVVTGDLIEGTITPKLLERVAPGSIEQRRDDVGSLPTTTDMGEAIAIAATDTTLPSGHTVVVGGPLDSLRPPAGTPEG